MPRFSVLMPTRNRPELFRRALGSVLDQRDATVEVVVVDDGSDAVHLAGYAAIQRDAPPWVRFVTLPQRARGHGQSFATNTAADAAYGDYLCFLDDDDLWIDPQHLSRATRAIELAGELDLYLADQVAIREGMRLDRPVWIEDLRRRVTLAAPDEVGSHPVAADELLRASGFCHVNATIVRRVFFLDLGGFDEGSRYEYDRDFYLRAIDRAQAIRYAPFVVAQHHVPVATATANASTVLAASDKLLHQLRLLDRTLVHARRPELRRYARRNKAYTLQKLAVVLGQSGAHHAAALYALEALAVRLSPRWLVATLLYHARALTAAFPLVFR